MRGTAKCRHGKVPAHPCAIVKHVQSIGRAVAHAVPVFEVGVNPASDGYDLRITGHRVAGDLLGALTYLVERAIAALQLARTDVGNSLMQLGIEPQTRSREELKASAETEKKKWAHLIKAAGLKPG